MTGWLLGAFFAAGIALVLLADIASSLHAIAMHLAEYRMDGMKRELRMAARSSSSGERDDA